MNHSRSTDPRPARRLSSVVVLITLTISVASLAGVYNGSLPDFDGDRHNWVMDYETGEYLRPMLPGSGFEFPKVAHCDWNNDGKFDMIVGYNLRSPDSLRTVIYLNQGDHGDPKFTGRNSPDTCFYLKTRYQGENGFRMFTGKALPMNGHPHNWTSHIPNVYDFTGDGLFDLLIGEMNFFSRSDMQRQGVWLLVNTGSLGNPEFGICAYLHRPETSSHLPPGPYLEAMELFQNIPGVSTGNHPTVNILDWDSDGVMDISYAVNWTEIIYGKITPEGKWAPRQASWSPENYSREGGQWGGFGRVPDMATVDWDGDGVNELIVADIQTTSGEWGYLNLYVNDPQNPGQYTRDIAQMYTQNFNSNPDGMSDFGWWHPKIGVFDWDEDGDDDILVGWGGGNGQPATQTGERIVLIRTQGGTPGSSPLYGSPLPVAMSALVAERVDGRAVIRWRVYEADGEEQFFVHRSRVGGVREKLSTAPVPATEGIHEFVDGSPLIDASEYWIEEVLPSGDPIWHGPALLPAGASLQTRVSLGPAHPNPTSLQTSLSYRVGARTDVQLTVYDARGRRVAELVTGTKDPGNHVATWDGRNRSGQRVAPGVYYAMLRGNGTVQNQKITIVK